MFALDIKNLQKTYRSGTCALKGVNLQIAEGDFFTLLGPNGAGKTTLISIVTSLAKKSGGAAHLYGRNIDTDYPAAKRLMGIVPQEFNFNMFETVFTMLVIGAGYYGVPLKKAKERAEYFLKRLNLWDKKDKPIRTLSGGMKRRLMIARALLHQPKLLILDEPTSDIDVELRRDMWVFLKELNAQGTTILLTTHNLDEAEQLSKNIAIIADGEIILHGAKQTVLQKINKHTYQVELKEPLFELPHNDTFKISKIEPLQLEVDISRNQSFNDLFVFFTTNNILIQNIQPKMNRLEKLFLEMTNPSKPEASDYVD